MSGSGGLIHTANDIQEVASSHCEFQAHHTNQAYAEMSSIFEEGLHFPDNRAGRGKARWSCIAPVVTFKWAHTCWGSSESRQRVV